jgi:hypothetical protein
MGNKKTNGGKEQYRRKITEKRTTTESQKIGKNEMRKNDEG